MKTSQIKRIATLGLCILGTLIFSFKATKSYASAYGSCTIKVKVLKVHEPVTYNKKFKSYRIKTELKLIKVNKIQGHSGGTMQCHMMKKHINKKYTIHLDAPGWEKAIQVKKDNIIQIKYTYSSGFGGGKVTKFISYSSYRVQ